MVGRHHSVLHCPSSLTRWPLRSFQGNLKLCGPHSIPQFHKWKNRRSSPTKICPWLENRGKYLYLVYTKQWLWASTLLSAGRVMHLFSTSTLWCAHSHFLMWWGDWSQRHNWLYATIRLHLSFLDPSAKTFTTPQFCLSQKTPSKPASD